MRNFRYQDSSIFAIRSASKSIERAMDIELRKRAGITLAQSRVIGTLTLAKNEMTQTELALKLGIEASTLVPIVDKLQILGLVERKADSEDRRQNNILLTSKSEVVWHSIITCAYEISQVSQNGIDSKDLDLSLSVLRKMTENVMAFIDKRNQDIESKSIAVRSRSLGRTHAVQEIKQFAKKSRKKSSWRAI